MAELLFVFAPGDHHGTYRVTVRFSCNGTLRPSLEVNKTNRPFSLCPHIGAFAWESRFLSGTYKRVYDITLLCTPRRRKSFDRYVTVKTISEHFSHEDKEYK